MATAQGEAIRDAAPAKGKRKASIQWVRQEAVCERYGIALRTLTNWLTADSFPEPVIFGRLRMWDESELDAFDERKKMARDAAKEVSRAKRRASEERASKKARGA